MEAAIQKNISINISIPENITVFADSNMLASTLRNLVSNSVKFTHKVIGSVETPTSKQITLQNCNA
jgi:signal transduction histidine kinase